MSSAPGRPAHSQGSPAAEAPSGRGRTEPAAPDPHTRDPHRRTAARPRLREKVVLVGYRIGEWLLGHLPLGPAALVGGWASVVVYWSWPQKRRIVEANCARVLGLPVGDRRVGKLARQVYRNQVRWVLELMRLHRLSRAEMIRQVDPSIVEPFEAAWKGSDGLIVAAPHFGNNEAGAAGLASRGWPLHAVADDTAYEDLFNYFREERRRWGVELVPWKNLRGVFKVLRVKEILILLVDWGYRADGIPVRFFGEWTTFPAGPAVLAAKTGAAIVALAVERGVDGKYHVHLGERVLVASADPAEQQRATQAIADDLEQMIRRAPEQWAVFKPIWPLDPADRAALAARVGAGPSAGAASPGSNPAVTPDG